MRKPKVAVIDILSKSASRKAYSRHTRANTQSIMPQVVAVWCEELGHDVSMVYHDGPEVLCGAVPDDVDIVFISSFSTNALVAYALSAYYRSKGKVTVLGGPHARSFPNDSARHFDYVVGFCDKETVRDILQDCSRQRPTGQQLSAARQPPSLPGVRQRWKFIEPLFDHSRVMRVVPMIGSLGCPYTCSFCIDALVPYQPLDYGETKEDLRFILANKRPRTIVAWHDPNFGVRFDEHLDLIEEAVPPGSLTFLAESSLSLLTEPHVKRMAHNGFKLILPGIESWYEFGGKAKTGSKHGMEKVRVAAEQTNMILSHIPYMQANFIFGLDSDEGAEPFELTKRYADLAPGVMPYFSLLISCGRNGPDSLRYEREGRVINIPFHFLNQIHAMNVRPKNYSWLEIYDHITDLYAHCYSWSAIAKRVTARNKNPLTRVEQLVRNVTLERKHKYGHHRRMRDRLRTDRKLVAFLDGETRELPSMFVEPIRRDLGWLWDWLPEGAIYHNPNAYLEALGSEMQAGMSTA